MAEPEEIDYTSLPLQEKLSHKVWKARKSGYEDLQSIFKKTSSSNSPVFKTHFDHIKMIPAESNMVALESGLSAVKVFVEYSDMAGKLRNLVLGTVIEKGLVANRTSSKVKSIELIQSFVEFDSPRPVVDELLKFLDHKTPKVVAASINALAVIIKTYGAKQIDVKPILSQVNKMFGHSDRLVRQEATTLMVEIYKWIKDSINPFIDSFSSIQQKALNEEFSKYSDFVASAEKSLGKEEEEQEQPEPEPEEEPIEEIDHATLHEPVTVLDKLPNDFYDRIDSSAWKERKAALEQAEQVLNTLKISNADHYHELVGALNKRLTDSNVLLVLIASQCIDHLARGKYRYLDTTTGLGKSFASYKGIVIKNLLEKLKEKKSNILEALTGALDAISASVSTSEIVGDALSVQSHKNPNVKTESILWLCRTLQKTRDPLGKADVKLVAEAATRLLDDGAKEVREAAAQLFATLKKLIGERSCVQYYDGLDSIKQGKVNEYYDKVNVAGVKKKKLKEKENSPPDSSSDKGDNVKSGLGPVKAKTGTRKPSKPSSKPVKPMKPISTGNDESYNIESSKPIKSSKSSFMNNSDFFDLKSVKFAFSDDQALDHVKSFISDEIIAKLKDSAWKIRLEGMDQVVNIVEAISADASAEAFICFFKSYPGFKESNFQVVGKIIQSVTIITTWQSLSHSVLPVIPFLLEKQSDSKQKQLATECLNSLADKLSLGFIIEAVSMDKGPKVIVDQFKWIEQALRQYGVKGVNVVEFVQKLKKGVENANALVRASAIAVLCVLYEFIGEDIRVMVQGVSSNVLSSIEGEFKKIKRAESDEKLNVKPNMNSSSNVKSNTNLKSSNSSPPVNVASLIPPSLFSLLSSAQWKERKQALETLQSLLKDKKLEPNLGQLVTEIKARLSDNNKNLVMMTLGIVCTLIDAVPKGERLARVFGGEIITNLCDNKVRTAAASCLTSISQSKGLDPLVPSIAAALTNDNPNQRKELLQLINVQLCNCNDPNPLVSSLVLCLLDKLPEIRKLAQQCILLVHDVVGYEAIAEQVQDFKAANLQSVQPFLATLKGRVGGDGNEKTEKMTKSGSNLMSKSNSIEKMPSEKLNSSNEKMSRSNDKIPTSNDKAIPKSKQQQKSNQEAISFKSFEDKKDSRQDRDRGLSKWNYEPDRRDLFQLLQEQFEPHVTSAMMSKLFSDDFKDHLFCLDVIGKIGGDVVPVLDLVLKYLSVRLYDSNSVVINKVLDLIGQLLELLDSLDYHLMEYEAFCLLPHLIQKTGDAKETVRQKVRQLLVQTCHVYPASKLFSYLLDAVRSKNARARAESLEEMGALIERNGMSVCPGKGIGIVAGFIADRDTGVRNAALNALVKAIRLDGSIRAGLRIEDKYMSLLDERLKRNESSKPVVKSVGNSSINSVNASNIPSNNNNNNNNNNSPKPFSLNLEGLNLPKLSSAVNADPMKIIQVPNPKVPLYSTPATSSRFNSSLYLYDYIATQVSQNDPLMAIEATRQFTQICSTQPEQLTRHLPVILTAIIAKLNECFTHEAPMGIDVSDYVRLRKHIVNALVQVFTNAPLAKAVTRDTLSALLNELVDRLLDDRVNLMESGEQLCRALNVLTSRVLENSNRNYTFSILLAKLEQSCLGETRYVELVMKCLWKITKMIKDSVDSINVDDLLFDIDLFLTRIPPAEWKKRAAEKAPFADMPLKTVKTIIHELVLALGESVNSHLTRIDQKSYVYSYLHYMLENLSKKEAIQLDEAGANAMLTKIFHKIGSKDDTSQGMQELYNFAKQYPRFSPKIESHLLKTGDFFQGYIRRGIANIAIERKESVPDLCNEEYVVNQEPSIDYKSRLQKIQEMFGLQVQEEKKEEEQVATIANESKPLKEKSEAVAALKERLAKLKQGNQ